MDFRDFKLSEKIDIKLRSKFILESKVAQMALCLPKRYEAQSSNSNTKQIQCGSSCLDYNRFCFRNGGQKASTGVHNSMFLLSQIRRGRLQTSTDSIERVLHLKNMIFIPIQDAKKQLKIFSFLREG